MNYLSDRKHLGTSSGELTTPGIHGIQKSKPKVFGFTDQQIEVAKRWGRGDSYSKICSDLGIRNSSQISNTLRDFEPTAKIIWKAVKELREAGYWRKAFKQDKRVEEYIVRGREAKRQMLREGLWPYPRHSIPWGTIYDKEKKTLRSNPAKKVILTEYVTRCANGEIPHAVATELGIPHAVMYSILENPLFKGYAHLVDETFPFRWLAVVDEKTWDKAHENRMEIKKQKTKPGVPPLGTKWVGHNLIPHDPDKKIGKLVEFRLKRYGIYSIAKELHIAPQTIRSALGRDRLYIDLGMVEREVWKKMQKIRVDRDEHYSRWGEEAEAKILAYLAKHGPSMTSLIAKGTGISDTSVRRYLRQRKGDLFERESGQFGKWSLLEKIKPK